jgi:RHH-type transcriptional regulator, rel operon repressor / antitoxin RelB
VKTVSIRIDDDIKRRWDALADAHGLNASHLMRQAIADKLEELEDFYVVKVRTSAPFDPVPNDAVWRKLGLAD